MGGVRKEGILQVNTSGGGPGTAVDITAPIGSNPMADSVSVTIASDQPPIPVASAPLVRTASDVFTAPSDEVTIDTSGMGVVGFDISGLWSGIEIICLATTGGSSQVGVPAHKVQMNAGNPYGIGNSAIEGNGRYVVNVAGYDSFQLYCNNIASGSINVEIYAASITLPLDINVFLQGALNETIAEVTATGELKVDGSNVVQPITGTVDVGLGTSSIPGDNTLPEAMSKVAAWGMVYDGVTWDAERQPVTDTELRATPVPVAANQGTPNAIANGWPVKVTDGVDTATISPAATIPTLAADTAINVSLRETGNAFGALGTSFVVVGGADAVGTGQKMPIRSPADPFQRADTDAGVLVRPLNAVLVVTQVFSGNGTLSANMARYNANTAFFTIVDVALTFNATLKARVVDSAGNGYLTFVFRARDGAKIDAGTSLAVNEAYFATVSGATIFSIECASYVTGTATVRIAVSPGTSGLQSVSISNPAGDSAVNIQGVLEALVNDVPESYISGETQPLSLTNDGRLRVSSVDSNLDKVWQRTFISPWPDENVFDEDRQSYGW